MLVSMQIRTPVYGLSVKIECKSGLETIASGSQLRGDYYTLSPAGFLEIPMGTKEPTCQGTVLKIMVYLAQMPIVPCWKTKLY